LKRLGVKGSQVQILSARQLARGAKPLVDATSSDCGRWGSEGPVGQGRAVDRRARRRTWGCRPRAM